MELDFEMDGQLVVRIGVLRGSGASFVGYCEQE